MKNDGTHGFVLLRRVKVLDDLANIANTKQFMGIEELSLTIVREIRGENAVRSALPALVFASCAGLGGAVTSP